MSENKVLKIEKIKEKRDTLGRRVGKREFYSDESRVKNSIAQNNKLKELWQKPEYRKLKISQMRTSQDEIIKRFREVWGNEYDYSKVEYKGKNNPVTIICKKHGEFEMIPKVHTGSNTKTQKKLPQGCKLCLVDEVLKEFKKVHKNRYNYSKSEFQFKGHSIQKNKKILIICKEHGEFMQTVKSHLRGGMHPISQKIQSGLTRRKR